MVLKLLLLLGVALSGSVRAGDSDFVEYDGVPWRYSSVGRTISIGDLHGDGDAFVAILQHTGIITSDGHLTGRNRLVLLGDIPSRGRDSRFIFDFVEHLKQEAYERFPGTPDLILSLNGNHEVMRCVGDDQWADHLAMRVEGKGVRYPESASFAYLDLIADRALPIAKAARAYLLSDTIHLSSAGDRLNPLERLHEVDEYAYYHAFTSNKSPYAQAIRRQDTIVVEDDTLFVHAGLDLWMGSKDPAFSIGIINATIRQYLGDWIDHQTVPQPVRPFRHWIADMPGPLWTRLLANEEVNAESLAIIMEKIGVQRIVIGHERNVSGVIETRYGGKVFRTDTGISRVFGGGLSAMEFVPGQPPKIIDHIPRPQGTHPVRYIWEPIFAAQRAKKSAAVAELHKVLDEIQNYEVDCAARLADFDTDFTLRD